MLFRNRFFLTKSFADETRDIRQELEKGRYATTRARKRLLHNDQTRVPLGRNIANELEPSSVATLSGKQKLTITAVQNPFTCEDRFILFSQIQL
ncbi:hypothetical protein YC2023_058897 [Brassica napus]